MSEECSYQPVFLPIIGVILLVPPIFLTGRWIFIFNRVPTNHTDRVIEFLEIFPIALRDARLLTWIEIAFSVSVIFVGFIGINRLRGGLRFLCFAEAILGGLMTLWLLFSMM